MRLGEERRAVKPSAQPTLVRTQHLPPPAKTARSLRKRGPAGRFLLVPPCVIVCRCRSWRSDRYGHMADSVRAEGAVRGTACFADPCPFCPVTRPPGLPHLTGARCASRAAGSPPFCSCWAACWSCPCLWPGQAGGSVRVLPSRRRGGGDRVRAARRRVEDWPGRCCGQRRYARVWTLHERRCHVAGGVPGALLRDWIWLSWSFTCRVLVMYLSWTRRILRW